MEERNLETRSGVIEGNKAEVHKSDPELIAALADRDPDAMEQIYQRYEPVLRTVILSVLHEEGDTDDVLHDVFLQLWNQSDKLMPEKGLHGFLVTMARRRALDRLRRRLTYRRVTDRFESELKAEFKDELRANESQTANHDLSEFLEGMISELPKAQQEVVHLTFFEGMSQREIAARKAIALGTVKTRLQLARKKLWHQLVPLQDKI